MPSLSIAPFSFIVLELRCSVVKSFVFAECLLENFMWSISVLFWRNVNECQRNSEFLPGFVEDCHSFGLNISITVVLMLWSPMHSSKCQFMKPPLFNIYFLYLVALLPHPPVIFISNVQIFSFVSGCIYFHCHYWLFGDRSMYFSHTVSGDTLVWVMH